MDDLPCVAVVGESDTGKTSLIKSLIENLNERGYSPASIKHTRGDFSIDEKGTDTWEHAESGSKLVVFSTPRETTFMIKEKRELDDILQSIDQLGCHDIVLIEGMRDIDISKISTDDSVEADIYYDGNLDELIDFIQEKIDLNEILTELPLADCRKCGFNSCRDFSIAVYEGEIEIEDCVSRESISLRVNGEDVQISDFPEHMLKNGINGLLGSLKGVDEIEKVEIEYEVTKD